MENKINKYDGMMKEQINFYCNFSINEIFIHTLLKDVLTWIVNVLRKVVEKSVKHG